MSHSKMSECVVKCTGIASSILHGGSVTCLLEKPDISRKSIN